MVARQPQLFLLLITPARGLRIEDIADRFGAVYALLTTKKVSNASSPERHLGF